MPARPEGIIEKLALHVATGGAVKRFAEEHEIVLRTAYRWYADPRFKARVNAIRERITNQLVGIFVQGSTSCAATLWEIACDKELPPTARVSAAKGFLDAMANVRAHADEARRLEELERQLAELKGMK
jgi:hypothetical protein